MPDRRYTGTRESAPLRTSLDGEDLIIRQVLPASSPFKPVRKCIALSRTLIDVCPGSVTLHPDVVFLRRETICSTLFLFPTPLLLLQVEVEEEVKEEVEVEDEVD